MLSIFPIMFLAPLAYTILRLFVGGVFLYFGIRHLTHDRAALAVMLRDRLPFYIGFFPLWFALVEITIAGLLIVGFATQLAALAGMFFAIKILVLRRRLTPPIFPQSLVYVLLLGACISLAITGAGALAVDLPI